MTEWKPGMVELFRVCTKLSQATADITEGNCGPSDRTWLSYTYNHSGKIIYCHMLQLSSNLCILPLEVTIAFRAESFKV
jgi:hypothetical protein